MKRYALRNEAGRYYCGITQTFCSRSLCTAYLYPNKRIARQAAISFGEGVPVPVVRASEFSWRLLDEVAA